MARRLYCRDSYGRVQRARDAERRTGGGSALPGRLALKALLILAVIMVLASLIH
jgi:hypothetical protein